MIYTYKYKSPLGHILLAADEVGITGLWFEGQKYFANTLPDKHIPQETEILTEAKKWLDVYFSGEEPKFTPEENISVNTMKIQSVEGDGFNIQTGSVEDFIADSLWTDDHIRRNCPQNGRDEKCIPHVCPGSWRCGWTQ